MLELWGMQSAPSLLSLQGPLLPKVLAPERILSMDQIVLNCVLCKTELLEIELFWHLTVCK